MKEETRKVVVLDWEDKIKLQPIIKDLERIYETYKSPCKGSPPYATILKALGWPGFFKCEFSTCTDSVICDILIKHVNWPSAEERWNEV